MRIETADWIDLRHIIAVSLLVGLLFSGFGLVMLSVGDDTKHNNFSPEGTVNPNSATDSLHQDGFTGAGVSVGIVDVTGFDTTQSRFEDRIVATRSFGSKRTQQISNPNSHGTASAVIVSQTAPDADLYLSSVSSETEFAAAIEWLIGQDVDVIVSPVSFYARSGDDTSTAENAVKSATEEDIAVVTPSGNLGQGHWEGQYLPVSVGPSTDDTQFNETHKFGTDGQNEIIGDSEQFALWLSWNTTRAVEPFVAELYVNTDDGPELIGETQPTAGQASIHWLVTDMDPDASYFIVVRGGENPPGTRFRIATPTHALETNSRAGTLVPPATATDAITVGAYDVRTGLVESYSGVGPTPDGEAGVDIVAPSRLDTGSDVFTGTSAATAYVGGIAALVVAANPQHSSQDIQTILSESAEPITPSSGETVEGSGRVDPIAALNRT